MTEDEAVASVLADMRAVRRAFAASGLMAARPESRAASMVGGPAAAEALRRDLLLADALLRNRVARQGKGPRHVVTFGGTKVGKSTVVNILAQAALAPVSPEGGFTRWPWAFLTRGDPIAGRAHAFADFARVTPDAADPERTDQYCAVLAPASALPRDVVVWDTPDCDSVGAERYLPGLIEALSLADLVIYVTSIEKYAVAALVNWVFELRGAGLALLECLNKTPARDRALVLRKQAEDIFPRMARERGEAPPDIPAVALRVMTEGTEADLWDGAQHKEAAALREAAWRHAAGPLARRAAAFDAARRIARVLAVAGEARAARATWEEATRAATAAFLRRYEEEYLASGEVIEPFTRLNVEIMALLDYDNRELNAALQFIRRWTTLPSRLVLQAGRQVYDLLAGRAGSGDGAELAPQARAFANAHADLLNALGRLIDRERAATPHHPFWDQLAAAWQAALPRLHEGFGEQLAAQLGNTNAEVHAAAEAIVARLRQRPAMLGALKGARIATQAGAVVVGFIVPHGGLVHDLLEELIITPLLLGATEKSADFLVGAYVDQRRRELVAHLRADAAQLAERVYAAPLRALGEAAKAIDLDPEILERLPRRLHDLAAALPEAAR